MLYDLLKQNNYRPSTLQKTVVGHFEMMVTLDGVDTNFIVDTGAAKTVECGFPQQSPQRLN